jgi:hypothetical protein
MTKVRFYGASSIVILFVAKLRLWTLCYKISVVSQVSMPTYYVEQSHTNYLAQIKYL